MATSTVDITIQTLRDTLVNEAYQHEPWTSGVISLSKPETKLFYESEDGTPRVLKFGLNNEDEVQTLSETCQPATFGLNKQDVLDEAYRKAGKLDADRVFWRFNPPDNEDFATKLASDLFPWKTLDNGIRFEPYKLNVYRSGSFFKAHKDTPRDKNMFGSLVVILPVNHEGGELVLRHQGHEFVFNGQALIEGASSISAAYVAFFSDVEHEVSRVSSGSRITVTYNLYFDSKKSTPSTYVPAELKLEHPFKIELRRIKEDSVLRDAHPVLGFGLEYAYPFEAAIQLPTNLNLKGSDAVLIKAFDELGIGYDFFLLYRQNEDNDVSPVRILSRNIINGDDDYGKEEMLDKILTEEAWLVWEECPNEIIPETPMGWHGCDFRYVATRQHPRSVPSLDVEWVTKLREEHLDRSTALVYGNEVSVGYQYHQLCVIARFSPGPPLVRIAKVGLGS